MPKVSAACCTDSTKISHQRHQHGDAGQGGQHQAQGQAQATETQMNAFSNAFSACLEGKQYIAKF